MQSRGMLVRSINLVYFYVSKGQAALNKLKYLKFEEFYMEIIYIFSKASQTNVFQVAIKHLEL